MSHESYLLIAGTTTILLAVCHSILGEYFIFRHLRKTIIEVPQKPSFFFSRGKKEIIWATWHLSSILGIGIGVILMLVTYTDTILLSAKITKILSMTMFSSALLVLCGTRGKHPGWIVLGIIGLLLLLCNF